MENLFTQTINNNFPLNAPRHLLDPPLIAVVLNVIKFELLRVSFRIIEFKLVQIAGICTYWIIKETN